MKLPVNLQELLAQNLEAIAATSTLIAQEMVIINATDVDRLTTEDIERILGNIPKTWDFNKLKTIFNADTVSSSLEQQLTEWCDCEASRRHRRQGKQSQPKLILKGKAEEKKALDIFKLRDMVKNTSNILILEPLNLPEKDTDAFIVTLQYALERAIQALYKLENDELASERIGKGKYLLFWEAAEGGAGVLSQIL